MDPRQSRFTAAIDGVQVRDSGASSGAFTFKGHAAVFNSRCDFGPFEEQIAPGAFTRSLEASPLEVLAVLNHDPAMILGTTMNGTLELEQDERGLAFWTRSAPTSYAMDARMLVERGDLQQASFKFTIADETWEVREQEDQDDEVIVTINEIGKLFDISLCGLGAYSQTDVSVASRARLADALAEGRVPGLTLDEARKRGLVSQDPERFGGFLSLNDIREKEGLPPVGEDAAATPERAEDDAEVWLEQARAEMQSAARAI